MDDARSEYADSKLAAVVPALSVLVVDDEEPLARMSSRLLSRLGLLPTTFTSPVVALASFYADPQKFDLLFTDHLMPEMNGSELAAKVLSARPDMLAILCTGFSGMAPAASDGVAQFDVVLMKPFTSAELKQALYDAVALRQGQRAPGAAQEP